MGQSRPLFINWKSKFEDVDGIRTSDLRWRTQQLYQPSLPYLNRCDPVSKLDQRANQEHLLVLQQTQLKWFNEKQNPKNVRIPLSTEWNRAQEFIRPASVGGSKSFLGLKTRLQLWRASLKIWTLKANEETTSKPFRLVSTPAREKNERWK